MRIVSAVLRGCLTSTPCRSPGRLTGLKASGTRRASIHGRPLRHHYAAAIQFLGREPDPLKSGSSSPSALARVLDPPQSGSRSTAAIQLLLPSGSNPRNRGTVHALPEEDAIAEGRVPIAQGGDEQQQRLPCFVGRRVLEGRLCRVPTFVISGGTFLLEVLLGVVSEVFGDDSPCLNLTGFEPFTETAKSDF